MYSASVVCICVCLYPGSACLFLGGSCRALDSWIQGCVPQPVRGIFVRREGTMGNDSRDGRCGGCHKGTSGLALQHLSPRSPSLSPSPVPKSVSAGCGLHEHKHGTLGLHLAEKSQQLGWGKTIAHLLRAFHCRAALENNKTGTWRLGCVPGTDRIASETEPHPPSFPLSPSYAASGQKQRLHF